MSIKRICFIVSSTRFTTEVTVGAGVILECIIRGGSNVWAALNMVAKALEAAFNIAKKDTVRLTLTLLFDELCSLVKWKPVAVWKSNNLSSLVAGIFYPAFHLKSAIPGR